MLTKTKLKEHIDNFPEQFSIDELIEQLILLEKIEKGKTQSQNDEVLSEAELNEEVNKWFA